MPRLLKAAYGVGQLAKGIEHGAMNLFVLFYFQQVLGVPGWIVGLGLGASLILDAITDPLMGWLSDRTTHRWGRRHPWMIASALPLGICFALLFSPPDLGPVALGAWAITWLIATRLALTVFFVPHLALGVELATDHDERTRVQAWRVFFTYLGSALVVLGARAVFLAPSEAYPDGQLDPSGYPPLGLTFGAIMVFAVLGSAVGTWSIRHPKARIADIPGLIETISGPLRNRPFRIFITSLLLFFVARGVGMALEVYLGTYFWALGPDAVALPGLTLLGVLVGTPLWALVAHRAEKRTAYLSGMALYATTWSLPPLLELAGAFPGGPARLPTLLAVSFVGGLGGAAAVVSGASMLADITDVHEAQTGQRIEGVFFGALSFGRKAATGLGGLAAGLLLTTIDFPEQATPGTIEARTVAALGIAAGPGAGILVLIALAMGWRYPLTRAQHRQLQSSLTRELRSDAQDGAPDPPGS
ncbi:MAG TPA: hypothetical protein ENK18_09180 [Deltaproteobacteria bacterium]|nr:hypothetical protein [Deltaproteobacteria bacterium]